MATISNGPGSVATMPGVPNSVATMPKDPDAVATIPKNPKPHHPRVDRSPEWTFNQANHHSADNTSLWQKLHSLGREAHFNTFLNLRDGYCGLLPTRVSNGVKDLEIGLQYQCFDALVQEESAFAPYILEPYSSHVFGLYDNFTARGLAILTIVVQDPADAYAPLVVEVTDALGSSKKISLDGHIGLYDFLVHILDIEIASASRQSNGFQASMQDGINRLQRLSPEHYHFSTEVGTRKNVMVKCVAPPLALMKMTAVNKILEETDRVWRILTAKRRKALEALERKALEALERKAGVVTPSQPQPPPPPPPAPPPSFPALPLSLPQWLPRYNEIVQEELFVPPQDQHVFHGTIDQSLEIMLQEISRLPPAMQQIAEANMRKIWWIMFVRSQDRKLDTADQSQSIVSWAQEWEMSGFHIKRTPWIADGVGQAILYTQSTSYRCNIWEIMASGSVPPLPLQALFALSRGPHQDEWVPAPMFEVARPPSTPFQPQNEVPVPMPDVAFQAQNGDAMCGVE